LKKRFQKFIFNQIETLGVYCKENINKLSKLITRLPDIQTMKKRQTRADKRTKKV